MKSDFAAVGSRIRNAGVLVLALLATVCHEPTGPSQRVTSVSVSLDSALVYVRDSLLGHAVAHDAQGGAVASATITWSSRDTRVAKVSPAGWVTAINGGRTSVIADAGSVRDSLMIIVLRRGVTVLSSRLDTLVFIKQSHQLLASTSDSAGPVAGSYLWVSRDPSLVSVTQSGRITARGPGATWVVATEDGGTRDSARVVVRQRAARVAITPAVISRPVARTQQFSAVAVDSGGTAVAGLTTTWSSDVPAVAVIDTAGLATAGGTGVDSIRAQMGGVNGLAVLTVSPLPDLRFTRDTFDLGVGQYATSFALPTPRVVTDSLRLDESFYAHLAVADTLIAVATESLPVREQFTLVGRQPGATTLTASAPHYVSANAAIRVSTPRLSATLIVATSDTVSTDEVLRLRIYVADSLGHDHFLVGPLTVTAQSSDTTVVRPQADTLIVLANDVGVNTAVLPSRAGSAWVRYTAPGYRPDSLHLVIVQPRLQFIQPTGTPLHTATIGVGQFLGGGLAFVGNGSVPGPDTARISITQRHPELVQIPPNELQQTVPQGGRATLDWSGKALGLDTIVASAPGFSPDTLLLYVTTPRYGACPLPLTVRRDQLAHMGIMAQDSTGGSHYLVAPVRAVVTSSDTTVLTLASDTVPVVSGISCLNGYARIVPKSLGSATLTLSDPAGGYPTLVTPPITVQPTPVLIGLGYPVSHRTSLGMHQRLSRDSIPFVTIFDYFGSPVVVNLRSTNPAVASVSPAQVVLGDGPQPVEITGGDTSGPAWIVAEGQAITPDSMLVEVGRPQFVVRGRGVGPDSIYAIAVEVRDHLGNGRIAAEPVVATITSSNFTYLVADSSTLTVPAGAAASGTSPVHYLTPGFGILRASDPRAAYYRYEPGSTGVLPHSP